MKTYFNEVKKANFVKKDRNIKTKLKVYVK